ncbi:SGNH/GDSL hydrolase family protein [Edaphobacter sp. HDX4]|uniref:SGNH/GDSL hydrolase family protein n=1 Tax=Edaphobacter sp. HDX4 TaxID=2794064 RepID=UPI002FE52ECE
MTTVSATNVCDASGAKLDQVTITFTPCTPNGVTLSGFNVPGGGQSGFKKVSATVVNGAFSVSLHDTANTNPINIGYRVEIHDAGGATLLGPWVIQPTGATWSFDSFMPNYAPLALIQTGPQGIQGIQGIQGNQGIQGPVGPTGATGAKGDPGDVSKVLLGQAAGAAVASQLPTGRNRFNPATIKADTLILATTGAESAWGSSGYYYATDFIYVADLSQFITNTVVAKEGSAGCAFYSIDKTFMSSLSATVAANTAIAIPAGAAFVRFYAAYPAHPSGPNTAPLAPTAIMVVGGSVLPGSFVSFGYYGKEEVDAKVSPIQSTAIWSALKQTQNYLPKYANLLDLSRVQTSTAIGYPSATGIPSLATGVTGFSLYGPIPVYGGGTVTVNKMMHCNAGYGPAFMDANGAFLPMGTDLKTLWTAGVGIPANTTLNVPTTAVSFWPYFNVSASGSGNNAAIDSIATAMIVQGSTFSGTYIPFVGSGYDTVARAAAQPLAGVRVGWLGDSISAGYGSGIPLAPLVATLTGHTNSYDLSWTGRQMWHALDNTGKTATAFPTQAIVQGLDMLVLWLGTNLGGASNGPIGTATDTPSVGTTNANGITFPGGDTYCSQLKAVIEQLLAWNPNLRIIKASPYQSNNQNAATGSTGGAGYLPTPAALALLKAVYDADVAVAGLQYGIPVLNLYSEMGICNANNQTLLPDGTHPTASTQQNRIAPYFARNVIRYCIK